MPPTRQSGKQIKNLIWDDSSKIWKFWDGKLQVGDIEIGAVEIKNATDDTRVVVKTDGVNNALVVTQNSIPTHAVTQSGVWDIGTLTGITNSVSIKDENENQRILDTDDAVTTVNYADSDKDSVSNIVTASATLSRKVTDTYNNAGATTLVITRVVANV